MYTYKHKYKEKEREEHNTLSSTDKKVAILNHWTVKQITIGLE